MKNDNITHGPPIHFSVDGETLHAHAGQTIAAALYASGHRVFRRTRINGKPRGLYCGMGVCFDCIVKVNGETVRACMRYVEDGMQVTLPARFGRERGGA
jgi:predicted molibdopterin-dependent oxidoreductase YjgC